MPDVIDEFRTSGGVVGGMFAGVPLLLLTTRGRSTGKPRTTPLTYLEDGPRYLVFGSNLGRPKHPDWYRNLLASPQVTIEIGVRTLAARAEALSGADRDRWYELQCQASPVFREYQDKTGRIIPVVALHPLDLSGDAARGRAIGAQLRAHHDDLRASLARVRAVLNGKSADLPGITEQLRQRCLSFCYGLQLHHIREDGAFTAFEDRFPHLAEPIAALRSQHHAIAGALATLEELLPGGDVTRIRAALEDAVSGLEGHFAWEERLFA
jgi:deazaflavin-dependent oxidoreductase (nitroreductase family)